MNIQKKYIKSEPLKELETMYHQQLLIANVDAKKTYFSDKNTLELTKSVISYLKLNGVHAESVATKGHQILDDKGNKKWVKSHGNVGSADVHCIVEGKALMIEIKCKYTKDRLSNEQKKYAKSVRDAGGRYWVITDFEELYYKYDWTKLKKSKCA
jgi:hypothetical protein